MTRRGPAIPIGVNPTSIGVTAGWWLDTAALLEEAGFAAVWCWDHFIGRGRRPVPALECWTMLAAAAVRTSRIRVGSYVTNVMNRHPAVLASVTATVGAASGGRVDVGIGAGGHPAEHAALGIEFPSVSERLTRLEEAVAVLRAVWGGGELDMRGRHYRLAGALAAQLVDPPPRIVVAGQGARSSRLAGRVGDAWTTTPGAFEAHRDAWRRGLEESGREPRSAGVVIELALDRRADPYRQPLLADLESLSAEWAELGATEIVLANVRPEHVPALLAAAERGHLPG